MKIFLLSASKGDWDDTVYFDIGIYTSNELALDAWNKFKVIAESLIKGEEEKRPMPAEEYENFYTQESLLTPEQDLLIEQYTNWEYSRTEAHKINFNIYWIKELELDKTDFSLIYEKQFDDEL